MVIPVNAIHDSLLLWRKMAIFWIIRDVVRFLVCIRCAAVDTWNVLLPPVRCVRAKAFSMRTYILFGIVKVTLPIGIRVAAAG
jgi:hypothetical protein